MLDALAQVLGVPLVSERTIFQTGRASRLTGSARSQGAGRCARVAARFGNARSWPSEDLVLQRLGRCLAFTGRSWYAGALRVLGIEVHVVHLPDAWRQRILDAQRRQYRWAPTTDTRRGLASARRRPLPQRDRPQRQHRPHGRASLLARQSGSIDPRSRRPSMSLDSLIHMPHPVLLPDIHVCLPKGSASLTVPAIVLCSAQSVMLW